MANSLAKNSYCFSTESHITSNPYTRAAQTSMTQTEEAEGELSNSRLSQKQFHSHKEKDVVVGESRGSQVSFTLSFGLME
jgi:hypothetical protein